MFSTIFLLNQSSHLSIHTQKKQLRIGVYLDPRWSSTTSKSAEGLQKVRIMKPLFLLLAALINPAPDPR